MADESNEDILKLLKNLKPSDIDEATKSLTELLEAMRKIEKLEKDSLERNERISQLILEKNQLNSTATQRANKLAEATKKVDDAEKELRNKRKGFAPKTEEEIKLDEKRLAQAQENLKSLQDQSDRLKEVNKELATNNSELTKNKNLLKQQKEARKSSEAELKKANVDTPKNLEQGEKTLEQLEEGKGRLGTIQQALGQSLGGQSGGFLGQIYRSATSAIDSMNQLSAAAKVAGGYGPMLANSFKLAQVALSAVGGVIGLVGLGAIAIFAKMALEVDNLSKNLGAATGFGDQFGDEITNMAQKGNMAGIGFKESAEALKSLTENVSSFNPAAERTNEYMGMTVARLQKLGVGAGESAKAMDFFQRTMGMTGEVAADLTAQIARMGKEIGITGTKMISNFTAASARLAIYGKDNIKVFKELAAQAKATGMEIGSLISISEKFDKFDSAAESAAKLNAVLGTQLSTLQMMNATDSERVMMIKQQVQASVGNFDSLDKFTKMYIAQAMGVKDVAEAQRLLNMSTAEYQKYQQGQQEQADIQAELAEATASLVPMMQQLKLAGVQLMMMLKPLIKFFSAVVSGASAIVSGIGQLFPVFSSGSDAIDILIGALAAGAIAWYAFGTAVVTATGGLVLIIPALLALFGAFHKKGSPELWDLPNHAADGYLSMAEGMGAAAMAADATSASLKGVHDSFHKAGGQKFSIEAMAKLDTDKIASGITKVKSALMELSTLKIDGFLAMSTDGVSTSMIMGSKGLISKISEGKLTVDVKMPEMKMPDINVKVYIGDRELRDIIRTEVSSVVGAAG